MINISKNGMTVNIDDNNAIILLRGLEHTEKSLLLSLLFFIEDGFPPEERTFNTVKWLLDLFGDDFDNKPADIDYFVKVFENNWGEWHLGSILFHTFRNLDSQIQSNAVLKINNQLKQHVFLNEIN